MSKHKAFLPETRVIGASPVLDFNQKLNRVEPVIAQQTMKVPAHGDEPYMRKGQPVWRKPKPVKLVQFWKSEAAKRRCGGDMAKATPNDLKLVPIYQGMGARLHSEIVYMLRRQKAQEEARRAKMNPVQRALDAMGLGGEASHAAVAAS